MTNDPATIVRRLYDEVINGGNLDAVDELLATDYVEHPEEARGIDVFKERVRAFRQAFPDLHVTLDEVMVEGDRLSSRATMRGTHTGDLMGIPATGRSVNVLGVDLVHVRDGRAAERWGGLDMFGLLSQLGAIPGGH